MIRKKKFLNLTVFFWALMFGCWISLTGCEAFVRKFTRKTKKKARIEEQVIQPQTYPDVSLTREELYRDYYLFWESWTSELLNNFMYEDANRKKQKECVEEAWDNITKMRSLLKEDKALALQNIIDEFAVFKSILFQNRLNRADVTYLRNKLERIRAKARRGFIFARIKKDLK